jgi:hypothetical protein
MKNELQKIVIGIDPDCEKSGVAVCINGELVNLYNFKFFQLLNYLERFRNAKVYIEAGWLNQSNWHAKGNHKYAAQIGQRTGANHEVGRKIVEMCEHLQITYELVKPSSHKMSADIFERAFKYEGRTNQEQRDAAALIAGFIKEV